MWTILGLFLAMHQACAETERLTIPSAAGDLLVQFSPGYIEELVQGDETVVYYNITGVEQGLSGNIELYMKIHESEPEVARLVSNDTLQIDLGDTSTWAGNITIQGVFLGRTYLMFYQKLPEGSELEGNATKEAAESQYRYHIAVIRPKRILDTVFIAVVAIVVLVPKVGMGCKLDLKVVRDVLKKPLAPIIGFICQFVIMPGVSGPLKGQIIRVTNMEPG